MNSNTVHIPKSFEESQKNVYENTIRDCKLLYPYKTPWECGYGLINHISDLSYDLEALNITLGKKYRFRITADQVKTKFAELRFYYHIHFESPLLYRFMSVALEFLRNAVFGHFDYKMENFPVKPRHLNYRINIMSKDRFAQERKIYENSANTNVHEYDDFRMTEIHTTVFEEYERRPTRHRIAYWFNRNLDKLARRLDFSTWYTLTPEMNVIMQYVYNTVDEKIRRCENRCSEICEWCGASLSPPRSEKCVINGGWITYVCERCAEESGKTYTKGGKCYLGKNVVDENDKENS